MVNRAEIVEFFKLAGPHGLGDHRPEFGRFRVEQVEWNPINLAGRWHGVAWRGPAWRGGAF